MQTLRQHAPVPQQHWKCQGSRQGHATAISPLCRHVSHQHAGHGSFLTRQAQGSARGHLTAAPQSSAYMPLHHPLHPS